MPAVNVLIKPASSACNMACAYCFYRDVAEHREHAFEGMLSLERMEQVIAAAMEYAEGICSFAFQGGEPTLAGLEFYQSVVELKKNTPDPACGSTTPSKRMATASTRRGRRSWRKTTFWWAFPWTGRRSCTI